MQYVERHTEALDWITLFLSGCIVLYTLAKYLYPRRFQEYIYLPLSNKYFLVQGKSDEIQHPFNILLFIAQVITMSLFIFLILRTLSPEMPKNNPWLFLQICTGYTVFILVKFYVEKIIGSLFNMDTLINKYLYQKLSYRNLIAVLVFMGNLIFYYIITPSETGLLVFTLVLLALNGIALFYSYKTNGKLIMSNFFYFILYLCALEISPYIILYKVIT